MAPLPRITLITPSYQQAEFLEECLASVHAQGYPDLEHIVVDGGSSDGSRTIIERYADRLAWWCSEKDGGQSHAINKGLKHASGGIFGWLNSDDLLLPGALLRVGEAFAADPDMTVLTAIRLAREPDGSQHPLPLEDVHDTTRLFTAPLINQQSTFYRMDVVRAAEGVEEGLQYVMDYELWLQVLLRNGPSGVRTEPSELAVFRAHPRSKTTLAHHRFLDEIASVLHTLCEQVGEHELMVMLATGHRITAGLRMFPVSDDQRVLVRAMVFHFLLKWHHMIYSEGDFHMMRHFRQAFPETPTDLGDAQRIRLEGLKRQLRAPNWFAFRLQRKLRHLLGR